MEHGWRGHASEIVLPEKDGLSTSTMYYMVHVGPCLDYGLPIIQCNVINLIWSLQQKTGWCYASQTKLAKATFISVPTLVSALQQLECRGLIERSPHRGVFGTTLWRLSIEPSNKMKKRASLLKEAHDRAKDTKEGT